MKPDAPKQNPANPDDESLKALWDWNFTNHQPTPEAIRKMEGLRSAAKAFKDAIIDLAPHSRERSLSLTSLEQSLFHVNSAIARNETVDLQDDTPDEDKALAAEQASEKPTNPEEEKS